MEEAYQKVVKYSFEAGGIHWYCSSILSNKYDEEIWVDIEELKKNGQEDTHMSGTAEYIDGEWSWGVEGDPSQIKTYGGQHACDEIINYLNTHKHPELT